MTSQPIYPFPAIVGQEKMKLALILNIINPTLSGVLIRGEKGTAKSTAVRALAHILPAIEVVRDCPFSLPAGDPDGVCRECPRTDCRRAVLSGEPAPTVRRGIRVVELPVGATEDRVVGSMDLEHALKKGEKRVEPGILAAAHRSILYVDEVNLLDDHVVDVLLDSAAMGVNTIEREGVSFTHPARFTLVGTMNPEEGELRPQLLDRFGLCVHIGGIHDAESRVAVMERRAAFDDDPEGFRARWDEASRSLVERIERAVELYPTVEVDRPCSTTSPPTAWTWAWTATGATSSSSKPPKPWPPTTAGTGWNGPTSTPPPSWSCPIASAANPCRTSWWTSTRFAAGSRRKGRCNGLSR